MRIIHKLKFLVSMVCAVLSPIKFRLLKLLSKVWSKLRSSGFSIILSLILVETIAMSYDHMQDFPILSLDNIASMDLTDVQRLMVIAPHPDDETLGAAGLIQAVLAKGGDVRIVIVTNGDGQAVGPMISSSPKLPIAKSYINYGHERQRESLNALSVLGVSKEKVIFLGYPDGELKNLWNNNWMEGKLISGKYTLATSSPYENTYNTSSVYLGSDLFQDIMQLLENFQPDLVLVPHPEDTNEDHRAISSFSRFAIANYQSHTSNKINILGYLIHYGGYPVPRGKDINKRLLPPAALSEDKRDWLSYGLTTDERLTKINAIQTYRTQQKIMGSYLNSFGRANEIFFEIPTVNLPWLGVNLDDQVKEGLHIRSMLVEPVREKFGRFIFSGADLTSWQVIRLGDNICFSAGTRGKIQDEISYKILVKLPDGVTIKGKGEKDLLIFPDRFFGACFNLEELGNPNVIGFSAETWGGVTLDRTAWYFVILNAQDLSTILSSSQS